MLCELEVFAYVQVLLTHLEFILIVMMIMIVYSRRKCCVSPYIFLYFISQENVQGLLTHSVYIISNVICVVQNSFSVFMLDICVMCISYCVSKK